MEVPEKSEGGPVVNSEVPPAFAFLNLSIVTRLLKGGKNNGRPVCRNEKRTTKIFGRDRISKREENSESL
jgi:hypothetical protein